MKLSIVTTLYQSAPYITEFHQRATRVAIEQAGGDYEIIMVNDGSPDESLALAVGLTKSDPKVVVIDLSRNFGHHKAMMTGLAHAKGEHVFLIDSDLEEDPEYLLPFAEQMATEDCDVVYGMQEKRKGRWFERWTGQWFYSLFSLLTGLTLPQNVLTARLMTRRYVEALVLHREREIFIAGLWHITGFDQRARIVKKHSTSETTYTLRRKVAIMANSIASFSQAPLMGIFYLGLIISTLAALYAGYLVFRWAFLVKPLSGWTSVMASIWLLGGMIISFIGVVGIYLSKIYSESKQRPYTIIRKIYASQSE